MRWDEIPWSATRAVEPPVPPLADLFARGSRRTAAMRYHVWDRASGLPQLALTAIYRRAPLETTTGLTVRVAAPLAIRRYRGKPMWQRMDRIIARLRPELADDPAAREALIARWFANTARAIAEVPSVQRLAAPSRASVRGLDHLAAARASGRPIVMTHVHTGTWEAIGPILNAHGFEGRVTSTWQPQPNRFENAIVAASRRRYPSKVLPPQPGLARMLLAFLSEPGQTLLLVLDEVSENQIKFPLFGRPAPRRCNLTFALRAARKTGALILPATNTRTDGVRFTFRFHPPIDPAEFEGDPLTAGAEALDALYEPHVLAHLDQWYMLHELRL